MKRTASALHFTKMLLTLIKGNTSLVDSLHILSREGIEKQVRDSAYALLLVMKKGRGFSESLRLLQDGKVFYDQMHITLITAAELTGTIDDVLERIAYDLSRKQKAAGNVLNIIMYPVVIIIIAIMGTVLLVVKGMPVFIAGGFLSGEILSSAINGIITATYSNGYFTHINICARRYMKLKTDEGFSFIETIIAISIILILSAAREYGILYVYDPITDTVWPVSNDMPKDSNDPNNSKNSTNHRKGD